jgi:hypothetical protein
MLDPVLRRWIDPPLTRTGAWIANRGVSANGLSLAGLAIGLSCVPLLAFGHYGLALGAILINRLFDGLDGAVARQGQPSAVGGYLDIVCDMAFYAAIPLGFALARPENSIWAALLLASFVCTCASFLGRAVMAADRGEGAEVVLPCGRPDGRDGDDPGLRPVLSLPDGLPVACRVCGLAVLLDGGGAGHFDLLRRVEFLISESFEGAPIRRAIAEGPSKFLIKIILLEKMTQIGLVSIDLPIHFKYGC